MGITPVVCRQCGTSNPPGNNFCGQCGAFLSAKPTPRAFPRPGEPTGEEARNRRNIAIIYAIVAIFVITCVILSLVVIIWRP